MAGSTTDRPNHPARKQIVDFIRNNPGSHYCFIRRALDIPNTSFNIHIHRLERDGHITHRKVGVYKLFYPDQQGYHMERVVFNPPERMAIEALSKHEQMNIEELNKSTGLSRKSLYRHLKNLQLKEVVHIERSSRCNMYSISNHKSVTAKQ